MKNNNIITNLQNNLENVRRQYCYGWTLLIMSHYYRARHALPSSFDGQHSLSHTYNLITQQYTNNDKRKRTRNRVHEIATAINSLVVCIIQANNTKTNNKITQNSKSKKSRAQNAFPVTVFLHSNNYLSIPCVPKLYSGLKSIQLVAFHRRMICADALLSKIMNKIQHFDSSNMNSVHTLIMNSVNHLL